LVSFLYFSLLQLPLIVRGGDRQMTK